MKFLRTLFLVATTFAFASAAHAQAPAASKPKPFSSGDARTYTVVAESLQFQMRMSERLRGRFKETAPDMVTLGSKLAKEVTELYTPGVDLAQAHGVDPKKIPQDMTTADKASLAKLNPIKDDKKWTVAFFEVFAKDSKKNAADAEKAIKSTNDADLKAWVEKVAAVLKSQSETIDAKYKEVKTQK